MKHKVYQHFKGGIYVKLAEAVHTETNEIMVVYICASSGEVFVRPKEMFYDKVKTGNYSGPRFKEISETAGKICNKSLKIMY